MLLFDNVTTVTLCIIMFKISVVYFMLLYCLRSDNYYACTDLISTRTCCRHQQVNKIQNI